MPTQKLAEIKQKVAQMRQNLERWKSHNEVNAKPADGLLYDFLSDFLSILEDDESGYENTAETEYEADQPKPDEPERIENIATHQSDEEGEDTGGNNPGHKPGTP